jgi:hypothetical protein
VSHECPAFDSGVLGNHGDAAVWMLEDRMASFGTDVGEPGAGEGLNHLAEWNVGKGRAHAAAAI